MLRCHGELLISLETTSSAFDVSFLDVALLMELVLDSLQHPAVFVHQVNGCLSGYSRAFLSSAAQAS